MADVFDIHAGAVKASPKTVATLMRLQSENDILTSKVIDEGMLRAKLEQQVEELEKKAERLEAMEEALREHFGPMILAAHVGVGMMYASLSECRDKAEEGEVPMMPVLPGMCEAFERLSEQIGNHVAVIEDGGREIKALSLRPIDTEEAIGHAAVGSLVEAIINKLTGK